jgi:DNA-binding NtrC family response regulator
MRKAVKWEGKPATVLVVEDDELVRAGLCGSLRSLGFHVIEPDSCETALRSFIAHSPDVVVTDLRLPRGDAFEVLRKLHGLDASVPVFIMTGFGTIDLAVRAVKEGAEDFLTKPVDVNSLGNFVRSALERRKARSSGARPKFLGLPASASRATFEPRSPAMRRLEDQVERLRDVDCSILLLGETGTGKSVLARRLHAIGSRASAPFVDINCAGLTKDLVETELFGHERGAFTGAHSTKVGLLEAAHGGTLFLDEIGDVDVQVQPKLLKVLEEKRFRRMGDVRERTVDVRLVGATHHDLRAAVMQKTFRIDLYYRISTVSLTLPSLRERREDILPLAYHMLSALGAPSVDFAADAKQVLLDHEWPGNLRELKNVLERSLLLRNGDVVTADELRFDTPTGRSVSMPSAPESRASPTSSSFRTLSEVEREHIVGALVAENGRVEPAARRLGIPRSTLYQRIKDYGINPSKLRGAPTSEPPSRTD